MTPDDLSKEELRSVAEGLDLLHAQLVAKIPALEMAYIMAEEPAKAAHYRHLLDAHAKATLVYKLQSHFELAALEKPNA